jgi:UDP-N-acetylglucosamine:LPS N-acetylglucosamine transferase
VPEIQVVLAKGNNIELSELGSIPSNVIIVDKAPQIDLLKRASLCISHAGLNSTLESLAQGVPMVAIPLGYTSSVWQPALSITESVNPSESTSCRSTGCTRLSKEF